MGLDWEEIEFWLDAAEQLETRAQKD